jgi:hypothetical protein
MSSVRGAERIVLDQSGAVMARERPRRRNTRCHLTYANVMATVAVFLALGGGAYAATALPRASVGRSQLRDHAVSRTKLAPWAVDTRQLSHRAVTFSRLSTGVRARLLGHPTGPPGPKGDTGPRGPAGVDALGARRIRFDAAAETNPVPTTALDMPGLELQAICTLNGSDVNLGLRGRATEDTLLQANFTVDAGADPANPPPPGDPNVASANNQFQLAANTDTEFGGPGTQNGSGYFRVNARGVLVSESRTISLNLFEIVNADTGRCTVGGTAMPAT